MKIPLTVDAAYAFDYLAILGVKEMKGLDTVDQTQQCLDDLAALIAPLKLKEILCSDEFQRLVAANLKTFNLVDLARENQCEAKDVDDANTERFLAKKALQVKFFGTDIVETKNVK